MSKGFDSYTNFENSMFAMILLSPLAILTPVNYMTNSFLITNSAYQSITKYNIFGGSVYSVIIYLKCGHKIKAGKLYNSRTSHKELLFVLEDQIETEISSRKEYKKLIREEGLTPNIEKVHNYLIPAFSYLPIFFGVVMIIMVQCGVNTVGDIKEIEMFGTITEKTVTYDRYDNIDGYYYTVSNNYENIEYLVAVTEQIYDKFTEDTPVLLQAKKGSLGIIYDLQITAATDIANN